MKPKQLLNDLAQVTDALTDLFGQNSRVAAKASGLYLLVEDELNYRIDCAEERPAREMSDTEEFIAAHECGRMKDAQAIKYEGNSWTNNYRDA